MKFLLGALFTVFVAIVSVFAVVTSGVVNVWEQTKSIAQ
mgnify:FL=1